MQSTSRVLALTALRTGFGLRLAYWRRLRPAVGRIHRPIPAATPAQQSELEALVQRIVAAVGVGGAVAELEAEVNQRVYRLSGLTREEIANIEDTA